MKGTVVCGDTKLNRMKRKRRGAAGKRAVTAAK